MLISLCTPCLNRTHDLKLVIPSRLLAASLSPPVEIVIVNYNSKDDLNDYISSLQMPEGVTLTYRHYTGREYWHMAHGFNLAVLASNGEYFWLMGTDVYLTPDAITSARELIEDNYSDLMYTPDNNGVILCKKDKFIEAGGYDERFEFYGQEGLELNERLLRRGLKFQYLPAGIVSIISTPDREKTANFRIKRNKTGHSRQMRFIYDQCQKDKVMVANEGKEWGSWE